MKRENLKLVQKWIRNGQSNLKWLLFSASQKSVDRRVYFSIEKGNGSQPKRTNSETANTLINNFAHYFVNVSFHLGEGAKILWISVIFGN